MNPDSTSKPHQNILINDNLGLIYIINLPIYKIFSHFYSSKPKVKDIRLRL